MRKRPDRRAGGWRFNARAKHFMPAMFLPNMSGVQSSTKRQTDGPVRRSRADHEPFFKAVGLSNVSSCILTMSATEQRSAIAAAQDRASGGCLAPWRALTRSKVMKMIVLRSPACKRSRTEPMSVRFSGSSAEKASSINRISSSLASALAGTLRMSSP